MPLQDRQNPAAIVARILHPDCHDSAAALDRAVIDGPVLYRRLGAEQPAPEALLGRSTGLGLDAAHRRFRVAADVAVRNTGCLQVAHRRIGVRFRVENSNDVFLARV